MVLNVAFWLVDFPVFTQPRLERNDYVALLDGDTVFSAGL